MNVILIILFAIILSAFFSGMEIAFVASNRLRIELDRKQGVFGSKIIKLFTDNPGQYIATMLIGNNFSLVVYGLVFSQVLGKLLTPILGSDLLVLLLNTLISTTLILLIAEFLPKTIFIISPNLPSLRQTFLSDFFSKSARVKKNRRIWFSVRLIWIILLIAVNRVRRSRNLIIATSGYFKMLLTFPM